MQRGSGDGGGGGGGGRRTGLRKVKAQITIVRGSPNRVTLVKFKGLLRYQKPHVTDNISICAFAYNVQYADSLYCCLYSNIRYNIQCRITNFLHCVIYLIILLILLPLSCLVYMISVSVIIYMYISSFIQSGQQIIFSVKRASSTPLTADGATAHTGESYVSDRALD